MFKFNLKQLPSAFNDFFTPISSRHKYKTRLASNLHFTETNYEILNIRFKGVVLWNTEF